MEWIMDRYNIKELEEKIDRCKNMKLEDINPGDVDEMSSIKIDRRKSSNERILEFLTQVKNPYVFKVNGRLVRFSFSENDPIADEFFMQCLKTIYII